MKEGKEEVKMLTGVAGLTTSRERDSRTLEVSRRVVSKNSECRDEERRGVGGKSRRQEVVGRRRRRKKEEGSKNKALIC